MLEIRLLGQFDVRFNGQPVLIPSRPAQSLLARLALTAGVVHRREKLAGELWPDTTEQNARSNLRHALWRIRQALSQAGASPSDHFILADNIGVTFNPRARFDLDAAALERANRMTHTCEKTLLDAAALYGGELLPGFYDEWIAPHRVRLQIDFDVLMSKLVPGLRASGRWHDALRWSAHWAVYGESQEAACQEMALARRALSDGARNGDALQRHPPLPGETINRTLVLEQRQVLSPAFRAREDEHVVAPTPAPTLARRARTHKHRGAELATGSFLPRDLVHADGTLLSRFRRSFALGPSIAPAM